MKKALTILGMLVCLAIIIWCNAGCAKKKAQPLAPAVAPAIPIPEPMPMREHKPTSGVIPDPASTHPH
jgi:hypothetical protein